MFWMDDFGGRAEGRGGAFKVGYFQNLVYFILACPSFDAVVL